ncbi:MAG: cytochrome-c oxidase [Actinomycetia bacterium]|nr:cytochrome-c oxidase [Actinomycetes bacterium]MDQ1647137.1 hypothetical protein [Cryptosporangiaceae bacterium]MDQ1653611.1 hypothetical protein [Cryptosporangiaceae bacterium]MDQ1658212.1 hypothetical protein [Cryptosporangiaceae bacterium]
MKSEARIFNGITAFLWLMAVIYGVWTTNTTEHTDWIGTTALVLSGALCGLCGGYFWFVSRRIELRPEDRGDAEIDEGAGELGFFSPGSYWPFGVALSAAFTGFGIAFWAPWLIALGGVALITAIGGLLFEYYIGPSANH